MCKESNSTCLLLIDEDLNNIAGIFCKNLVFNIIYEFQEGDFIPIFSFKCWPVYDFLQ